MTNTPEPITLHNTSGEEVNFVVSEVKDAFLQKIIILLDQKIDPQSEQYEENRENVLELYQNKFKEKIGDCLKKIEQQEEQRIFDSMMGENGNFTKKFEKKYPRYFPMYFDSIIQEIRSNILLDKNKRNETENKDKINSRSLYTSVLLTHKKTQKILYIFGDNLNPDEFSKVMQWDVEKIETLEESVKKTYSAFSGKGNEDLLEMYKHSIAKGLKEEEGKIDIDQEAVKEFIKKHVQNHFVSLFGLFKEWSVFAEDKKALINIQKEGNNMLRYILLLNQQLQCFPDFDQFTNNDNNLIESVLHSFISDEGYVHDFTFFKRLLEEGIDIKVNNDESNGAEITDIISDIKVEKKVRIDEIVQREFMHLSDIGSIDDLKRERNKLNYLDRKKAFFTYVFYEKEGGLELSQNIFPQNIEQDNEIFEDFIMKVYGKKITPNEEGYAEYKQERVAKKTKKWKRIVKNVGEYSGNMSEYLKTTGDDLEMITDYFVYTINGGMVPEDEEKQSEGLEKSLLRNLSNNKNLHNITFDIDDNVKNVSSMTSKVSLDLWKKSFSHLPINIEDSKFSFLKTSGNKEGENIHFTHCKELFCPNTQGSIEDNNAITDWLHQGMGACNDILQKRPVRKGNQKYVSVLGQYGIDTQNISVMSHLRVFLKFLLHRNESLTEMNDDGVSTTTILSDVMSGKNAKKFRNHMGETLITSKIGAPKKTFTAFHKLVTRKKGDLKSLTDLARSMNVFETFSDAQEGVEKFLEYIQKSHKGGVEKVSIDQYTGNYMRISKKQTGYRDISLLVKLHGVKTPIEVQFHYKELVDFKMQGIDFSELTDMYKENDISFSQEEIEILASHNREQGKFLPADFSEICEGEVNIPESIIDTGKTKISGDDCYHISRDLGEYPDLQEKFSKMEYYGYAQAMGKIRALEYKQNIKPE